MKKLKLDELGRKSVSEYKEARKNPVVVVLDNIRSKNNVGTVFRNSDGFLVEKVFLCGYTPAPPDRDITKTAIGAELSVPWEKRQDILEVVQELKANGYSIVSVEQAAGSVMLDEFKVDSAKKYALVMGNEVAGVQQEVVDLSDACLEIPMFGTKHSFNIAVASGIALYGMLGNNPYGLS